MICNYKQNFSRLFLWTALAALVFGISCTKKSKNSDENADGAAGTTSGVNPDIANDPNCEGENCENGLGGNGENNSNSGSSSLSLSLSVAPMFPTNGSGWFDAVKYDGVSLTTTTDLNCNETADTICYFGGELRKVAISDRDSCDNLTMEDNLGVYKWKCEDEGSTIYFYSYAFNKSKGLRNLVNASSWKNNHVILKLSGSTIGQSSPATWFSESVTPAPANPNSGDGAEILNTADTIYTVASSTTTDGYNINNDRIAFVTLEGATLTYTGNATNNCNDDGETTSPINRQVICFGAQDFVWIEGDYHETGTPSFTSSTIYVADNNYHARLNNIDIDTGNFYTDTARNSRYTDIEINGRSGANCIWYYASHNSYLYDISVTNCSNGIQLSYSTGNSLVNINGTNTGAAVVYPSSSSNSNIFVNLTLGFSNNRGIHIHDSDELTMTNVTFVNGLSDGFEINQSEKIFVSKAAIANVGDEGIYMTHASSKAKFYDIAIAHTDRGVFAETSGSELDVKGAFKIGNSGTSNCEITAGVTSNIDTGSTTCTESDAELTVTTGQSMTTVFTGQVTDDSANADTGSLDGNGFLNGNSVTDWHNFDDDFTIWGEGDSAGNLIHNDHRSNCSGEPCAMWDLSTQSSDTVIRNYTSATLPCPTSISGNDTLTDSWASANTFLRHAFEIMTDGIGNDNGLCESNEECIYAPNMGSYQGSGDYKSTQCNFVNGTLTDIKIYTLTRRFNLPFHIFLVNFRNPWHKG